MNFDNKIIRKGSGCLKWDQNLNIDYPLWVADMDFHVAPAITEALEERVKHGIFGYVKPSEEYFQSIINWHKIRHNAEYNREWFITVPGIVPAISAILKALTKPGDGVLLLSPGYNGFYSSIRNLECKAIECELQKVNNRFEIDFESLESLASRNDVKIMLLCTPHNPSGRIWSKNELQKIADICQRNNVFVVADEIHCEIIMPGNEFIPYSSLGSPIMENACICTSASKTFNIAGLQNAQIICPNEDYRSKIDRAVNVHEICDVNPFGVVATIAAYNHGEEWLDSFCNYIWKNYVDAKEYIAKNLPMLKVTDLEATYLMWLDISELNMSCTEFCEDLKSKKRVWLAEGCLYGKGGEKYVRINMATQHDFLLEALDKIKEYIIDPT